MNIAVCALVLSCGVLVSAAAPSDVVVVRGGGGQVCFEVEVADDVWSRARGLMHRDSLPEGSGMIFLYDEARPVAFWMKNVALPLDLLFIDDTGRIVRIAENARPGDLTPIRSGADVSSVLEIAGGASRRAQINRGDTVSLAVTDADRAFCENR